MKIDTMNINTKFGHSPYCMGNALHNLISRIESYFLQLVL